MKMASNADIWMRKKLIGILGAFGELLAYVYTECHEHRSEYFMSPFV